jgi:hypothetical protein
MKTIGHHTCSNDNGYNYVLEHAPFPAEFNKRKKPFLGEGYYFWDNNKSMAEKWGEDHYDGYYCILECTINIQDEILFDLVGSRTHQLKLQMLLNKFKNHKINKDEWELGNFIEFLKDLNNGNEYHGIFNYSAIRSVDNSRKPNFLIKFVKGFQPFTDLEPRYIICIINLENVTLDDKKLFCV